MYAELERAGALSQADIARQYRKSAGYVSILCRLGHALRPLTPDERGALRVPHVTFKAAQLLVSRERDGGAIRRALTELAAAHPALRRRRMAGSVAAWRAPVVVPPDQVSLDPLPLSRADEAARRADFVFPWDEAAARQDPAAVLEAYEQFVRSSTALLVERLRLLASTPTRARTDAALDVAAADAAAAEAGAAPSSARVRGAPVDPSGADGRGGGDGAPDAVAARPPLGWELSLRQLDARVGATLAAHRARMSEFLAERQEARHRARAIGSAGAPVGAPAGTPSDPRQRGGSLPPVEVSPDEIETDLAE
jgi:hypothetical protein